MAHLKHGPPPVWQSSSRLLYRQRHRCLVREVTGRAGDGQGIDASGRAWVRRRAAATAASSTNTTTTNGYCSEQKLTSQEQNGTAAPEKEDSRSHQQKQEQLFKGRKVPA